MSDASIKSTMNARLPASPVLLQGSAQAGANLSLAATAWMVSGITASPLLNTLLPALGALPFLLHLKRTARGYWLQIVGVLILLGVSLALKPMGEYKTLLLLGSFAAVLLFQIGQEISALPLQRQLIDEAGSSMKRLRSSQEIGSLIGNLLAALLFPALRQFLPALVLLLPLAVVSSRPARRPRPTGAENSSSNPLPWNRSCVLQGLVMGGLFALLALWVREIDGGRCFDFGMVLAAYGLGRTLLNNKIPALHSSWHLYGLLGALLGLGQVLPGWMTTVLFLPIGTLAAATDRQLVTTLMPNDPAQGWQILQRSGSIGGLAGVLLMGGLAQWLGLPISLGLQLVLFVTAPLLMRTIR